MVFNLIRFGQRVQAVRLSRGLTQEELAELADLSAHYIGNLEQGVRKPSIFALMQLCTALGTTPNELFDDSISDEMRQGISMAVTRDNTLREVSGMLLNLLGDLLPLEDEETAALFGVPLHQIPDAPDMRRNASLSDELLALQALLQGNESD